ncbi:hypothetical protein CHARACLAT_014261 [Characodon lateralis]|uniref:Uncharacterized protein n=1 Tax=Characodon lateralis TaxID=208331 RepID=A0ABU7DU87_9TELE|nr:hypothetical protein [Characodon lateralis]
MCTNYGSFTALRSCTPVQNSSHRKPPKTKRRPHPSKANHPSPPQKETYTHPNIRTTPRAHKTLDTQVDPAPRPPADPLASQQNVLLEGRSTCNEMGPTCQFGGPYAHRCIKGPRARECTSPKPRRHTRPGPKTPKAQPGPRPGG